MSELPILSIEFYYLSIASEYHRTCRRGAADGTNAVDRKSHDFPTHQLCLWHVYKFRCVAGVHF